VLPSGNANDHGRTMHDLPLAKLILKQKTAALDVLCVDIKHRDGTKERYYAHSYAGIGLTPGVAHHLERARHVRIPQTLVVLKAVSKHRPTKLKVRGKVHKYDSVVCSIIPEMGKLFTLYDKAQPDDGKFEIMVIRHGSRLRLYRRMFEGIVWQLGGRSREKAFRFTTVYRIRMQMDGELISLPSGADVTISICPKMLRTFASAAATGERDDAKRERGQADNQW
jgi:diacylglycerol kinase family enzyme